MTVTTRAFRPFDLATMSCCPLPTAIQATDSPGRIAATADRALRPLLEEYECPGSPAAVTAGGGLF